VASERVQSPSNTHPNKHQGGVSRYLSKTFQNARAEKLLRGENCIKINFFLSFALEVVIFFCRTLNFLPVDHIFFHVMVFWVVTSCSHIHGYRRFEVMCCLHLEGSTMWVQKLTSLLRHVTRNVILRPKDRGKKDAWPGPWDI
jgi:fatty-acid desaturase